MKLPQVKPQKVSAALRHVAAKLDRSKNPSRSLITQDIKRIIAAVDAEWISISISFPEGMNNAEIITRAKKLMPCKTGVFFEVEQQESDFIFGNMECEAGYYDSAEDSNEFGPDDAGVTVTWEKP